MKKNITKPSEKKQPQSSKNTADEFAFTKDNYKWMIIGVAVAFLGFILMSGGGTDDPTQFAGDSLFSFRRMTLAPIMILAGFSVVLFAIIKKTKEDHSA
jgi:hypothetical protein